MHLSAYSSVYGSLRPQVESRVEGALDSAGWFSLLSFSWLNPLFTVGAARQLRPEDLPGLARQDHTTVWADRCE